MDICKLRNYARLIARTGAAVQPGQSVIISAELDQPGFVEILVEECYEAGAADVRVEWSHQALRLLNVKYRSAEALGKLEDWEKEYLRNNPQIVELKTRYTEDEKALIDDILGGDEHEQF